MNESPNKMFNHVLCAVDGSEPACRAAAVAACIARDMDATISFVSVAEAAKASPQLEDYLKTEGIEGTPVPFHVPEAEDCLKKAISIAHECGASAVESAVEVGDTFEQLSAAIKKQGADLIILGHHARSSVGRLARKPLSQRIADELPVKLLLVP